MVKEREYKLTVMLDDYERKALEWLADREGWTNSDWLRQNLRRAYAAALDEEQQIRKGEVPRVTMIGSFDPPRRPGWVPGDRPLPSAAKPGKR